MNDISERCRYAFYKKTKYTELNNRNKNNRDSLSWIKNRNEALRLAWKEYKYTRKVEKVCPEFMYTSGFGLASYIKIKSLTEVRVLRDLGE